MRCSRRSRPSRRPCYSRSWGGWSSGDCVPQRRATARDVRVPPRPIQDAAYQSLLKSTRQHYHQRIAQVLEAQFAETAAAAPELLAHHYTEAGVLAQAIAYWQRAGQQAVECSAYAEAVSNLTTALHLLTTLPESRERSQQELVVQMTSARR